MLKTSLKSALGVVKSSIRRNGNEDDLFRLAVHLTRTRKTFRNNISKVSVITLEMLSRTCLMPEVLDERDSKFLALKNALKSEANQSNIQHTDRSIETALQKLISEIITQQPVIDVCKK